MLLRDSNGVLVQLVEGHRIAEHQYLRTFELLSITAKVSQLSQAVLQKVLITFSQLAELDLCLLQLMLDLERKQASVLVRPFRVKSLRLSSVHGIPHRQGRWVEVGQRFWTHHVHLLGGLLYHHWCRFPHCTTHGLLRKLVLCRVRFLNFVFRSEEASWLCRTGHRLI